MNKNNPFVYSVFFSKLQKVNVIWKMFVEINIFKHPSNVRFQDFVDKTALKYRESSPKGL